MNGSIIVLMAGFLAVVYSDNMHDRFYPELGVQFAHKGYIAAASSHYIHTIRYGGLPSSIIEELVGDTPRQNLRCRQGNLIRNVPESIRSLYCNQTYAWRKVLRERLKLINTEILEHKRDIINMFPDQTTYVNSTRLRKVRFVELLTGAASLISSIFDGYEKIMMAKQIHFLANNQERLYRAHNSLVEWLQTTRHHDQERFQNLHDRLVHQKTALKTLWSNVTTLAQSLNETNYDVAILNAVVKTMNFIYGSQMPAAEQLRAEVRMRQASLQTLMAGYLPSALLPPSEITRIISTANRRMRHLYAKIAITDLNLLYSMRIVTVQRLGDDLYISLLLPVVHVRDKGTFHLYSHNFSNSH